MASNKGMELTVETLVIFILAIVVLVAAVAFFMNTGKKGGDLLGCQQDFQVACNQFLADGGCGGSVGIEGYVDERTAQCGVGSTDYALVKQTCCR